MADLGSSGRIPVHPGVDPQSWLGFEQRIQTRRFEALVASARRAIATGDTVLAEHAIEEARELRPEAIELASLAFELRKLQPDPHGHTFVRRTVGAFGLLAAGVSMFLTLDALRLVPYQLPIIEPPRQTILSSFPTARTLEIPLSLALEEASPAVPEEPAAELPAASVRAERIQPKVGFRATSTSVASNRARVSGQPERIESRAIREVELPAVARSTPARLVPPPSAPIAASERPSTGVASTERITEATRTATVPPAADAPAGDAAAEERTRVAEVLRRYARAYGELDVSAAREVWPSVDQRALSRAFASLSSQTVSFDDCQIQVDGVMANASCRGRASYVGKVGHQAPRIEPRMWRFELRREGATWMIQNTEARRTSG